MYSILLAILLAGYPEPAEILVVTARKTALTSVSGLQLKQLYLKKLDRVAGVRLTPVQLQEGSSLRAQFDAFLFRKDFDLKNYWQEQVLTGGEKPPLTVRNEAYMLAYVERNPGFIGYVSVKLKSELPNFGLKILRVTGPAAK